MPSGAVEAPCVQAADIGLGGRQTPPWLHTTRVVLGLLSLGAVIAVVSHFGEARRFAEMVRRAQPAWLLLAAGLQVATYFCPGGVWWLVLRRTSSPQPLGTLVLLLARPERTGRAPGGHPLHTGAAARTLDFERRRLSVVVRRTAEEQALLVTKGAPESVLAISTAYEVGQSQSIPLDAAARARIVGTYEALGRTQPILCSRRASKASTSRSSRETASTSPRTSVRQTVRDVRARVGRRRTPGQARRRARGLSFSRDRSRFRARRCERLPRRATR